MATAVIGSFMGAIPVFHVSHPAEKPRGTRETRLKLAGWPQYKEWKVLLP